ncbi:MAG: gliding motility-associated C-terminal domain-containing protein [Flavobacteriales bacterium]|nr:gliding motility-associated C-terminal domain-containing protein [Flavobacteriales bacterium]
MLIRVFSFLFLLIPIFIWGSHNRGGEITYSHIGGLTYEFTITTCTDLGSATGTDRPELFLDFDLGTPFAQRDTLTRTSEVPLSLNHKKNIYVGIHTFTSTGTHRISLEDPNRNAGILNVWPGGNSDDVIFALETFLIISPVLGASGGNNSVQFTECPCPAIGCLNKPYCYNPMAYDPDGDSLSYELVVPLGQDALPLLLGSYYVFPDAIGGGNFTIDPVFGTVCWNNPLMVGEFNFTILISEWRNGYKIGSVIRDIQLTINNNCINNPPDISPIEDTCIKAGSTLNINIQGVDQDSDFISLTAAGLSFNLTNSPSTFSSVATNGIANGILQWNTNCSHIQQSSYPILIELEDNGIPVLSDYEAFNIEVRPPPITGLIASPIGSSIHLIWDKAICSNALGYNVYKKLGSINTFEECCQSTNLSSYGVSLVHQSSSNSDTTFIDFDSLEIGRSYCYFVTGIYDFGQLESCPSDTACSTLQKEVAILTNVSVVVTDSLQGIDSINWINPTELDTNQYQGPYHYKITNSNGNIIHQFSPKNFLYELENSYSTLNTNTVDTNRNYKVGLHYTYLNSDSLIGSSNPATSVHLRTVPNDNQIELFWNENVPWNNEMYYIFRSDSIDGNYTLIDSTIGSYFLDSGLTNRIQYCYYIKSIGEYTDPSIISPLINLSQKACDVPFDFTPPCPPSLTLQGDCDLEINTLNWTNPNNSCSDDALSYSLYFTPFLDSTYSLINFFDNIEDTTFQHQNQYNGVNSIAGCYYLTATDSMIYNNESLPSDTVCFDNCPNYMFPNIFTPNGDGINDYFQAIMPIKYIDNIELYILNRWGEVVFKTIDPEFLWDGTAEETKQDCPSGTYYFQCLVNSISLFGIETIELNGHVQLTRKNISNNQ